MALLTLGGTAFAESAQLEKNQGKRWVIVPAMMTHLKAMDLALKGPAPTTVEGHRKVAARLDSSLDSLIANCTMTGKAHDELHKWLVPMIGEIKSYSQGSDLKKLNQQHRDFQKAFVVFHEYFE